MGISCPTVFVLLLKCVWHRLYQRCPGAHMLCIRITMFSGLHQYRFVSLLLIAACDCPTWSPVAEPSVILAIGTRLRVAYCASPSHRLRVHLRVTNQPILVLSVPFDLLSMLALVARLCLGFAYLAPLSGPLVAVPVSLGLDQLRFPLPFLCQSCLASWLLALPPYNCRMLHP